MLEHYVNDSFRSMRQSEVTRTMSLSRRLSRVVGTTAELVFTRTFQVLDHSVSDFRSGAAPASQSEKNETSPDQQSASVALLSLVLQRRARHCV